MKTESAWLFIKKICKKLIKRCCHYNLNFVFAFSHYLQMAQVNHPCSPPQGNVRYSHPPYLPRQIEYRATRQDGMLVPANPYLHTGEFNINTRFLGHLSRRLK